MVTVTVNFCTRSHLKYIYFILAYFYTSRILMKTFTCNGVFSQCGDGGTIAAVFFFAFSYQTKLVAGVDPQHLFFSDERKNSYFIFCKVYLRLIRCQQ